MNSGVPALSTENLISFVIPCYNSAQTIGIVVHEIAGVMAKNGHERYEIILVNDASPDNVFEIIAGLCNADGRIKGIDLAKNFGQHAALLAGAKHTRGVAVVFLDDDGQTPANEADKLIYALDDDCDIVFAKYEKKRHDTWRNLGSRLNDRMAEALIGKPRHLSVTSYIACKRFIVDEICKYNGNYPYMSGLLLRTSKRIKNIAVKHRERESGRSGYTFRKLISLWLNGFTAFSVKPLRFATAMGFLTAAAGFGYGIYIVINRFLNQDIPIGWSSILAALLFIGGMLMIMLGLVGEYVGRIYINGNNAPQYVVRRRIGFDEDMRYEE